MTPQTFQFTARDLDGYADIDKVYFLFNGSAATPPNTCYGFYQRGTNALYLYNDAVSRLLHHNLPGRGWPVIAPLLLAGSFACAAVSYRFLEARFLRRRTHLPGATDARPESSATVVRVRPDGYSYSRGRRMDFVLPHTARSG